LQQPYFIVVLAHSLHGRLQRIHVPYTVIYTILGLAIIGAVSVMAVVGSYVRMADKTARFNDLRDEVAHLRSSYGKLQRESQAKDAQLATFQMYATEVSTIFGLRSKAEGSRSIVGEAPLVPTLSESLEEYNLLRTAEFSKFRQSNLLFQGGARPSLWPVSGRLMSYFGRREDPFSGEGAIHTGVDISVPPGTPVRATADGVVSFAGYHGGYGRKVVIDHGAGCSTHYAHLARNNVLAGQRVRRGDIIAFSGASGRATGPHLHYEVRMNGVAVNPYPYLKRSATVETAARKDFLF
jgi:murein DD-endopeptidase MepM/ murein hydrolase activator NlpD